MALADFYAGNDRQGRQLIWSSDERREDEYFYRK